MKKDTTRIINYLGKTRRTSITSRTKATLKRQFSELSSLEEYLCFLSKKGFIRTYYHPNATFKVQRIESRDDLVFYSLSSRGKELYRKEGKGIHR